MLATLVFNFQGQVIKFTVHEVLTIALDVIAELMGSLPAAPVATQQSPAVPMKTPIEWLAAARAITPSYSRYYQIGGHLIKCNQEKGPDLYPDYISDQGELPGQRAEMDANFIQHIRLVVVKVFFQHFHLVPGDTQFNKILFAITLGVMTMLTDNEGAFGKPEGPSYREFYQGFDQANMLYAGLTSDLKMIADKIIAVSIREILAGGNFPVNKVLPCLAAAMFLAESKRNHLAFITNLMLLDFVEMDIRYGKTKKRYTWQKILWHPSTIDPTHPKHVIEKDAYGVEIRDPDGTPNADLWGGKSSMASTNSTKNLKNNPAELRVPLIRQRQKEGSILIRWLYHVLQLRFPMASINFEVLFPPLSDNYTFDMRKVCAQFDAFNKQKLRSKKVEEILGKASKTETKKMEKIKNNLDSHFVDPRKLYLAVTYIRPTLRQRMATMQLPTDWDGLPEDRGDMSELEKQLSRYSGVNQAAEVDEKQQVVGA